MSYRDWEETSRYWFLQLFFSILPTARCRSTPFKVLSWYALPMFTHPFAETRSQPKEELRLRHRYLDLRRPTLSTNLKKRSDVSYIVRNVLHEESEFLVLCNATFAKLIVP